MRVLGIESSCDETAAAVVEDGRIVLSDVIASQAAIHARYGGVVPEVASRHHIESMAPVVRQALDDAGLDFADLDAIGVTYGPGLAGSLLVGVNTAKALAFARGLPLVAVNHLAGHVYAGWLHQRGAEAPPPRFPLLCLIVSGAHSDLTLMTGHWQFQRLARTRDDAAGEAFDKVSRLLGLGYPGGPAIEAAARAGRPGVVDLPRAEIKDSLDFSFSGLKTAVLRLVQAQRAVPPATADLAAEFQAAVVDTLVRNTVRAADRFGAVEILLAGGVAANRMLRERLASATQLPVRWPRPRWCTDNAAMVAAAGYYRYKLGQLAGLDLDLDASRKLGLNAATIPALHP